MEMPMMMIMIPLGRSDRLAGSPWRWRMMMLMMMMMMVMTMMRMMMRMGVASSH